MIQQFIYSIYKHFQTIIIEQALRIQWWPQTRSLAHLSPHIVTFFCTLAMYICEFGREVLCIYIENYAKWLHVIFWVVAVQMSVKISVLILLKEVTLSKTPKVNLGLDTFIVTSENQH